MKKKLYLDPTGVSGPEQQHMAMGSSEQGISMCHSCGMWPMTAFTKGHGPVLEKSLGTSTSKFGGLDRTQHQPGVIGNYGSCHYVQLSASLQGIEKLVLFGNNRPFLTDQFYSPSHPNPSSKPIYWGREAGGAWPSSSTELKAQQARPYLQLPALDLFEVFTCAGAVETQHCPHSIFITWIPHILSRWKR